MSTRSKSRYSSKSRQRSQKRSQSGGDAASWQLNNLGNGWTQFMNTFSLQPGSTNQSNNIVPNHPQRGGKKNGVMRQAQMRQRQMMQGKTGGYFGPILEKAMVPLALLGAQQFYGKNHSRRNNGRNKSFKRRR
jgi:hypothetical protein